MRVEEFKKGDNKVRIRHQLNHPDVTSLDGSTVMCVLKLANSSTIITKDADILDAADRIVEVEYDQSQIPATPTVKDDADRTGSHAFEWIATWEDSSGDEVKKFPTRRYHRLIMWPALN
jgi:hypothetical protein